MKTLDEVIKAYEVCHASVLSCEGCPYDNGETWRDDDCYVPDALHYLKEYQRDKQIYSYDIARRNLEVAERNDPLSWDELKLMKGKPVWVEGPLLTEGPHWIILGAVHLYEGKIVGYGKTWKAYRKERK